MERCKYSENTVAVLFLIIPTIFVIVGLLFFPFKYPGEEKNIAEILLPVPLFISLILLGTGFFLKKEAIANKFKIAGWGFFAFFWSAQPNTLYFGEDGDLVNAIICIIGVYVLFYFAYHEWLSSKRKENIGCLNWAAGAAAIAGIIYFGIEMTPLEMWLREVVAGQSAWLLNVFTGDVYVNGISIWYGYAHIEIIFACTAVQSMVLFVGMILPLKKVGINRKCYGLLVTVVPIYLLNLVRNVIVTYLVGNDITDFGTAHNIIGKGGSLLALVLLLFIVIKIVPEVFDEIIGLTDLIKRNGPIERFTKKYIWRAK